MTSLKCNHDQEVQEFKECWIDTPRVQQALAIINMSHRLSGAVALSCVVLGESGVGKSALANRVMRLAATPSTDELTSYGIVYVELETEPTVPIVCKQLLRAYGINDVDTYTRQKLKYRLFSQIKACKTSMVIIDEFQQLVRRNNRDFNSNVCNFIKELMRETNVPVLLMGMPEGARLLALDGQLPTRSSQPITLKEFSANTTEDIDDFQWFLNELVKKFPRKTVKLASRENTLRFLVITKGNIRRLKWIFIIVLEQTRNDPERTLSMVDIRKAYAIAAHDPKFHDANGQSFNPFRATRQTLERYLHDRADLK